MYDSFVIQKNTAFKIEVDYIKEHLKVLCPIETV